MLWSSSKPPEEMFRCLGDYSRKSGGGGSRGELHLLGQAYRLFRIPSKVTYHNINHVEHFSCQMPLCLPSPQHALEVHFQKLFLKECKLATFFKKLKKRKTMILADKHILCSLSYYTKPIQRHTALALTVDGSF